jgi:DNA polymerase
VDIKEQILELIKDANPDNPLQFAHSIVKDYSIDKLNEHIISCNDCGICGEGKSITKGNSNASILIVGESLSEEQKDNEISFPLEDASGEILNKVLDSFSINHDEVFYINSVSCWPHKVVGNEIVSRTPSKKEVDSCKVFVDYAIKVVQPRVIILLGSIALNLYKKESITKARGEWIDVFGIPSMPTYHPGYFIQIEGKKDPEIVEMLKWDFYDDLKKAFAYVDKEYPDNNVFLNEIESD